MSRTYIAYDNKWEAGTLTYTSQDANFPASNTQRRFYTRPWRNGIPSPAGGNELKTPIGPNFTLGGILIRKTNLTASAVVTATAYLSGTAVWASLMTPDEDLMAIWPPAITADQVGILFKDTANPEGYVEVGYIFAGPIFNPVRGFLRGTPETTDLSTMARSAGGQISGAIGSQYDTAPYIFQGTGERATFKAMYAARKALRPLFFCEDYRTPTISNTRFGRIAGYRETPMGPNHWTIEMAIEDYL